MRDRREKRKKNGKYLRERERRKKEKEKERAREKTKDGGIKRLRGQMWCSTNCLRIHCIFRHVTPHQRAEDSLICIRKCLRQRGEAAAETAYIFPTNF